MSIILIILQLSRAHALAGDKPLSKFASVRGFEGDTAPRSAAHSMFVSDSSTGSKYKSSAKVELQKRPEC